MAIRKETTMYGEILIKEGRREKGRKELKKSEFKLY